MPLCCYSLFLPVFYEVWTVITVNANLKMKILFLQPHYWCETHGVQCINQAPLELPGFSVLLKHTSVLGMFGKVLGPPETVMGNTAKMLLLCCWQSNVLRSHMVLFMTVWNSFTLSAISKQWIFSNEHEADEMYASQVCLLIFRAWNFAITGCSLDQNKLLKRFWFQIIWNPHLESISGSFTICQVIVCISRD